MTGRRGMWRIQQECRRRAGVVGRGTLGTAALVMIAMALISVGCRTADPGARNTLGNVSARVAGTPVEAVAATERAMRRMDMTIIASNVTDVDGRVTAQSPRRRPVDVRVFEDVDDQTRVSIRIGAFGDQDASIGLLQRIRRELQRDPAEYADFEYKFEEEEPVEPDESAEPAEPEQGQEPQDLDEDDAADDEAEAAADDD